MCKYMWATGLIGAIIVAGGLGYYVGQKHQRPHPFFHQHQQHTHPHFVSSSTIISQSAIPQTSNVIVTPYEHTKTFQSNDAIKTVTTGEKDGIQYKVVETRYKGKTPDRDINNQIHAFEVEDQHIQTQMNEMVNRMNKEFSEFPHIEITMPPNQKQ